jgi:hypothetical protein
MEDLESLLRFSQKALVNMHVNYNRIKERKFLLLTMVGASQHFCESIHLLLLDKKLISSQALTRSILENWLNSKYIFVGGRNKDTLLRFIADDELGLEKSIQSMLGLVQANHSLKTGMLDEAKLKELLLIVKKRIKLMKEKHPQATRPLPDLRARAKVVDDYNRQKRKTSPKYLLEWHYLIVYKYFCNDVHLGTRGLNGFLEQRPTGDINFAINGSHEDIESLAHTAFALHVDILNMLSLQFKYPSRTDLKPYLKRALELGK